MIYNQWYAVLDSKEVGKKQPVMVKRLGVKLTFWRDCSGGICCIEDKCCHRGASLGKGWLKGNHVVCPFHGFQYDKSGTVRLIPANGKNAAPPERFKVQSYIVVEKGGFIWLWWGDQDKCDSQPFFFEDLQNGFSYSQFIDPWAVHYSRTIENQLDVLHLPFVHGTTIGRGNRTIVNGPVVTSSGNLLKFYVNNVVDDGTTVPKTAGELPGYEKFPQLQFHFPNIWQNIISRDIRAVAAFVPVDEENTLVYIRYYQRSINLPVLGPLFSWIGKVVSIVILRQDKRVVQTQLPKKSSLKMEEKLVPGDAPIIEYRKRREQLINGG